MKLFFTGITCLIIICLYSLPVRAEMSGGVSDNKTSIGAVQSHARNCHFVNMLLGLYKTKTFAHFQLYSPSAQECITLRQAGNRTAPIHCTRCRTRNVNSVIGKRSASGRPQVILVTSSLLSA